MRKSIKVVSSPAPLRLLVVTLNFVTTCRKMLAKGESTGRVKAK